MCKDGLYYSGDKLPCGSLSVAVCLLYVYINVCVILSTMYVVWVGNLHVLLILYADIVEGCETLS